MKSKWVPFFVLLLFSLVFASFSCVGFSNFNFACSSSSPRHLLVITCFGRSALRCLALLLPLLQWRVSEIIRVSSASHPYKPYACLFCSELLWCLWLHANRAVCWDSTMPLWCSACCLFCRTLSRFQHILRNATFSDRCGDDSARSLQVCRNREAWTRCWLMSIAFFLLPLLSFPVFIFLSMSWRLSAHSSRQFISLQSFHLVISLRLFLPFCPVLFCLALAHRFPVFIFWSMCWRLRTFSFGQSEQTCASLSSFLVFLSIPSCSTLALLALPAQPCSVLLHVVVLFSPPPRVLSFPFFPSFPSFPFRPLSHSLSSSCRSTPLCWLLFVVLFLSLLLFFLFPFLLFLYCCSVIRLEFWALCCFPSFLCLFVLFLASLCCVVLFFPLLLLFCSVICLEFSALPVLFFLSFSYRFDLCLVPSFLSVSRHSAFLPWLFFLFPSFPLAVLFGHPPWALNFSVLSFLYFLFLSFPFRPLSHSLSSSCQFHAIMLCCPFSYFLPSCCFAQSSSSSSQLSDAFLPFLSFLFIFFLVPYLLVGFMPLCSVVICVVLYVLAFFLFPSVLLFCSVIRLEFSAFSDVGASHASHPQGRSVAH